jgi:hypothetical protein
VSGFGGAEDRGERLSGGLMVVSGAGVAMSTRSLRSSTPEIGVESAKLRAVDLDGVVRQGLDQWSRAPLADATVFVFALEHCLLFVLSKGHVLERQ